MCLNTCSSQVLMWLVTLCLLPRLHPLPPLCNTHTHTHAQAEVTAAAKAVSKLRGQLAGVPRVQSWAPEGQRTAVVVRKTGATPQLYPRAPGTPSKKPL